MNATKKITIDIIALCLILILAYISITLEIITNSSELDINSELHGTVIKVEYYGGGDIVWIQNNYTENEYSVLDGSKQISKSRMVYAQTTYVSQNYTDAGNQYFGVGNHVILFDHQNLIRNLDNGYEVTLWARTTNHCDIYGCYPPPLYP